MVNDSQKSKQILMRVGGGGCECVWIQGFDYSKIFRKWIGGFYTKFCKANDGKCNKYTNQSGGRTLGTEQDGSPHSIHTKQNWKNNIDPMLRKK